MVPQFPQTHSSNTNSETGDNQDEWQICAKALCAVPTELVVMPPTKSSLSRYICLHTTLK